MFYLLKDSAKVILKIKIVRQDCDVNVEAWQKSDIHQNKSHGFNYCTWHLIKVYLISEHSEMYIQAQSLLLYTFFCSVCGLPSYCYNYYSEFALNEDYNPTVYPEINTTITDLTTLYKVSEVTR